MAQPLMLVADLGEGLEFCALTIERLADLLRHQAYGADMAFHGLYGLAADGTPVPVTYEVEGAHEFDGDSWAYPTVKVTMPDGSVLSATYTIDGRA